MSRRRLDANSICVPIQLTLRTQQVDYVEYLAERDETNFSRALGFIVDKRMKSALLDPVRSTRKICKHLRILPNHLEHIDKLAVKLGLTRSDVARRLIDEALAKDGTI